MGGTVKPPAKARFSWPLLITYLAAAIGGVALVIGFARFNSLHQDFLSANFDSVHGARTLLKARFLIDSAARDVETAATMPDRRTMMLQAAGKRLLNAEHYAAEGRDSDAKTREELVERIRSTRQATQKLERMAIGTAENARIAALNEAALELQKLAREVDAAELDRWGTLAALNKELAARMATLNRFIAAAFMLFVGVMLTLGWALLRTRRAESGLLAAQAETEAIQQTTLDASPIGIAYIDTADPDNRRIVAVNRQMAEIFGYGPEMMPGLNVRRLYAGSDTYNRFTAIAPEKLARGDVLREEVVMQRRDGMPFWCALSIKAIDPENLTRVVWTCEDISARKASEAALQQERARAEAASRAKSEFLANMSHELRTPFTGLFGLLDLLARSRLDESQRRHVELARGSAMHMQAIVNDILDFSKIEAGKLIIERHPFRLHAIVTGIADCHATAAANKGLRFSLDIVEPLADALIGDAVRIRQIIDNLLNNAVKFTERGEVRLTVQSQADKEGYASLRITVEDTGIGIPAAMQLRIFDKFTQADTSTTRLFGGSGLGLAISKQLAAMMGGNISLSSAEGRGSRFSLTLRLPLAPADAKEGVTGADEAPPRLDGIVVLLAEDNPINREMLAETLEHAGAIVLTAETGAEAVRIVADQRPDIVLMDCQMPDLDGIEATRCIRENETPGTHLPIIALTAFATTNHRDACLAPGMMDAFMTKPMDTCELLRIVHNVAAPECRQLPVSAQSTHCAAFAPGLAAHVLLVEDNRAILESTRKTLERLGCTVDVAIDGSEALTLLETSLTGKEYDLILMDRQMPILDGLETTRRWRARERELGRTPLAIVAVTADERPETLAECRSAGMDDMLVKPFNPEQLQMLLRNWLE